MEAPPPSPPHAGGEEARDWAPKSLLEGVIFTHLGGLSGTCPIIGVRGRFLPVGAVVVLLLADGDVGLAPVRVSAVPVAFAGGEAHHVSGAEGVDGSACGLCLW